MRMWFAGGLQLRATGGHYGLASPQGHQIDGGPGDCAGGDPGRVHQEAGLCARDGGGSAGGADALRALRVQGTQVGHGDRSEFLRRLQDLHGGLPGGKQHRGGGQGSGEARPHMHWLRIDNYHEGSPENPKTYFQPVPCMQCENAPCELVCPVAATVHSQRRHERHGVQPLRGHALLLEQLPVQGSALQLPSVLRFRDAAVEVPAQSRCHGAQPRRDGEVHLLRPAHHARAESMPKSRTGKVRDGEIHDGLPAGVPDARRSSSAI